MQPHHNSLDNDW